MLIFDPTGIDDIQPFEQQNADLQKRHPQLIHHRVYENTGHNIHFERKKEFVEDMAKFLIKVKELNSLK